jgi:phosphate-selective porin OprO/OprP
LCLLATAGHALAQEAEQQQQPQQEGEEDVYAGRTTKAYNPETAVFGPLPRWRSDDGNLNFGGGAMMQFDFGTYSQTGQGGPETSQALNPDLEPGVRARRGILLASGVIYNDFIVFGIYDAFDTGDAVMDGLRSAVLAYRRFDPLWFMVGQQNIASPLDAATFSSRRQFMESAMSSDAFGLAPGTPSLGVSTMHRSDHHFLRLGLYGVPAKEVGENSEGYGIHGRATYAPISERTRALHFGVAGYWRKPTVLRGEAGGTERFHARPELRIDDTSFVDTGDIPRINDYYYTAFEFLGVYGSASVQAEYQRLHVNRYDGPHDAPFRDLTFDGYYVQAGYFLTGESPNYYPRFATLWRVQPFKEFDPEAGGWGAFEIAARYSHIDLDDGVNDLAGGGIRGGVGDNYTVGLNWYLTALTRISVNYVHSNIDNLSDTGLNEGEVIDAVGVRVQWEF